MGASPVLLAGCGRLGAAMLRGWLGSGALKPSDVAIMAPRVNAAMQGFAAQGVVIDPTPQWRARTLVLAVKPKVGSEALKAALPLLAEDAVVISVMAGVRAATLSLALKPGQSVARVMPSTGTAHGAGVACIHAEDERARHRAEAVFAPIATVIGLEREDDLDAATALCGSGPAFVFAQVAALAKGAEALGIAPALAARMARATLTSAAASVANDPRSLDELIAEVASPGGTTQAGLKVLEGALETLMTDAVGAAHRRAGELSGKP